MTVLAGTLTTGGAGDVFNANDVVVTSRTAVASGTADTMKMVVVVSAGSSITLVIYSDNAGAPNNLLGQTAATAVPGSGTMTLALLSGVTINSGTPYWLGVWVTGATLNLNDSTPGGYRGRNTTPLPNPMGSTTFSDPTNSLPITAEGSTGADGPILFQPIPFQTIPIT